MTTIFVFGSNTEGRHGKGAALYAAYNFGAIYGQAEGPQNDAYAIITKDLSKGERSISLEQIQDGIDRFHNYVSVPNRKEVFIISPLGTGLAGYSIDEIRPLFKKHVWPDNVYFHHKFL